MFIVIKSKKTEKCKVISFLEDMNPEFTALEFVDKYTNKKIYRIQYKNCFWLMGFCKPVSDNHSEYYGESNMFRTLKFDNKSDCDKFLNNVNGFYSTVRKEFNKDLEVII